MILDSIKIYKTIIKYYEDNVTTPFKSPHKPEYYTMTDYRPGYYLDDNFVLPNNTYHGNKLEGLGK